MRVGIDCRTLLNPKTGERAGIEHYTHYLVTNLIEHDIENTYVLFFYNADPALYMPYKRDNVEIVVIPFNKFRRLLPVIFAHVIAAWSLYRAKLDIYHNPANSIPLLYFKKSIITLHDLAIYQHPEWFPRGQFFSTKIVIPSSVKKAAGIIAVSDNTKRDAQEIFHVPDRKITIIHEGVENFSMIHPDPEHVRPEIRAITDPYFLYVGTIQPRKNIAKLIEAFDVFVKKYPAIPYRLVIAGKRGWRCERDFRLMNSVDSKERISYLGYVTQEEKVFLLKHGFCFVFPSLYEGFGLPILEAMNTGIPIITSNVGSMPEIVLDGAVLIEDPYSVDAIVEALEKITHFPSLRKGLIARGKKISFSFTWKRCAEYTLQYYAAVVKGVGRKRIE